MPIKIGDKTFAKFADAEQDIKKSKPGIEDPAAYVASIEQKQETLELDPRGDGAVRDDQGQSNIIDYSNDEPLLFGSGDNSSHEYPGKIVINNESNYVDREVKKNTIPGPAATGTDSVGHDTTEPTIPTGAPYELDHNMHGMNFNHQINWTEDIILEQLEKGKQVEMEHTKDPNIAEQIALDHLMEDPFYYSKLELIHETADIPAQNCNKCKRKSNEEYILQETVEPLKILQWDVLQESFKEEDHPRAPKGSEKGGEFVAKDAPYTMGSTFEDKKAREEFFKDSDADNAKIRDLSGDITAAQLDAGIARVKKEKDVEQKANAEVERLQAEQKALIQKLKDQDKLEGVQAQGAIQEIQDLEAQAMKKKEGSKGREKLRMEAGMMRIRLDLIRRGKIADFDIEGNPTNEAARAEKNEHRRFKKAMDKPVTKATKKDIEGFSGNVNVTLGRNVDVDHVNQVKDIWNSLPEEDRKLVDNFKIRGSRATGRTTAGEWIEKNKQMDIVTHPTNTKEDYAHFMHHEIGHAKFKLRDPAKIQKWNEAVKEISPPTNYAQWHKNRAFNYKLNNMTARKEDMPIIQRNITALENLYYEEIHSEIYAHTQQPIDKKRVYIQKGFDDALAIYKEIFGNG